MLEDDCWCAVGTYFEKHVRHRCLCNQPRYPRLHCNLRHFCTLPNVFECSLWRRGCNCLSVLALLWHDAALLRSAYVMIWSVLRVSSTCQDRGTSWSSSWTPLKTAWRFTKLSDSRWVTLGPDSHAGRHCVQGERRRFAIVVVRSAWLYPARRNLESCIRKRLSGGVFGRQCDALVRRCGRGRCR